MVDKYSYVKVHLDVTSSKVKSRIDNPETLATLDRHKTHDEVRLRQVFFCIIFQNSVVRLDEML
jgi:hypothetical protein